MERLKNPTVILFSTLALGASSSLADDWPQWLGPKRDGIWRETGIVERFPEDGPTLRWKTPIAGGYTGPAVSNQRVYVMDWVASEQTHPPRNLNKGEIPRNHNFVRELHPGTERVLCLNESDGKVLWKHEYQCDYTTVSAYAIGPRCTPTVDGDRVYTLGAEGHLFCFDTATGDIVWEKNFVEDYGLEVPFWGVAAHPLIDGDRLICMVGGKGTTCVAFEKSTGKEVWRSVDAKEPGYCAPVIYTIGEHRQLIVWDSDALRGLSPITGDIHWSVPFPPTFAMSIGVPQLEGRRLFAMSFNRVSGAIDVAADGRSAEIAWRGGGKRGLGGVMNSAVIVDGHVYGCGQGGRYICADLETGERKWATFAPTSGKRPLHWGSAFTIRHRDRFLIANDLGDLVIANMSPSGYEEVSRAHLIEPTHQVGRRKLVWSHPAFANRSIYLRNDTEIRCYSLAK